MAKPDTLTLLAGQISVPKMTAPKERDRHLEVTAEKVRAALKRAATPVDIVVLPELSSLDYSREAFSRLDQLAEPLDGPSFRVWRKIATQEGVFVTYGFARKSEGGKTICIAVVNPEGNLVGHYDKLHLAQYGASMEKEYFQRGDHLFTFDVKGFRLAPIICYDIRIPELTRALVIDHKVDLVLHCGAYYRDKSFPSWHAFVVTRALENQVFFLSLNRAGENFGASLFCPPWQDDTTPATRFEDTNEDFRTLTLDRRVLTKARSDYSFLKDRLDDYSIDLISG
ncbi:MAG: carbon-nitrogen hydrolase family protein [Pseudomonadota bacterium]